MESLSVLDVPRPNVNRTLLSRFRSLQDRDARSGANFGIKRDTRFINFLV
jgi:hypothetical protein